MNSITKIMLSVFLCTGMMASGQDAHAESGLKKGIVQEVLQVGSYTYLNMLEAGEKKWLAVPTIDAKIGESYYYKKGMVMPNYRSNELDRTFEEVAFLGSITKADAIDPDNGMVDPNAVAEEEAKTKAPTLERLEMSLDKPAGAIRISELFGNPEQYSGKPVKIMGEVTKFNGGILGTNWIHFQDGTAHDGEYDLMITSNSEVYVGEVLTFEGVITLNKDFGAGYFYKIIMESAIPIK